MAAKTDIDQDALAAEWGLALEAESGGGSAEMPMKPVVAAAAPGDGNDEMAAQWAAMIDDGSQFVQAAKGGAERILNQEGSQTAKSMTWMKIPPRGNGGGNRLRAATPRRAPTRRSDRLYKARPAGHKSTASQLPLPTHPPTLQ